MLKERMINRRFEIEGIKYLLVSVTQDMHGASLWILHENDRMARFKNMNMSYQPRKTNRDDLVRVPKEDAFDFSPRTFDFDGVLLKISRSTQGILSNDQTEDKNRLQHFIDNGLDMDFYKAMEKANICIMKLDVYDSKEFDIDHINYSNKLTITNGMNFVKFPLERKVLLPVGDYDQAIEIDLPNIETNKPFKCYVNGITLYDLWMNQEKLMNRERPEGMTLKEFEEWKITINSAYEVICPKDKHLALIEYETEGDVSISFYATKWLDTVIKPSANGSAGLIFKPDKENEKGLNGHRLFVQQLLPVDKDFSGNIQVELIDWTKIVEEKEYLFVQG